MVGWRPGSSSKSPQLLNCTSLKCEKNKKCSKKNTQNRGVSVICTLIFLYSGEHSNWKDGDGEKQRLKQYCITSFRHVTYNIPPGACQYGARPGQVPGCSLNPGSIQYLFYSGTKTNRTVQRPAQQPACGAFQCGAAPWLVCLYAERWR